MISMTWPQYQRQECMINRMRVRLSKAQAELLFLLLVRYPEPINVQEAVSYFFPDPDDEPENPEALVINYIRSLKRAIGGFRVIHRAARTTHQGGTYFWLIQDPKDQTT